MKYLTETELINYVQHYDYNIDSEQAKEIMSYLEEAFGVFNSTDIQMATDYVVMGSKSNFKDYFES